VAWKSSTAGHTEKSYYRHLKTDPDVKWKHWVESWWIIYIKVFFNSTNFLRLYLNSFKISPLWLSIVGNKKSLDYKNTVLTEDKYCKLVSVLLGRSRHSLSKTNESMHPPPTVDDLRSLCEKPQMSQMAFRRRQCDRTVRSFAIWANFFGVCLYNCKFRSLLPLGNTYSVFSEAPFWAIF
jgi:hypothetical protein